MAFTLIVDGEQVVLKLLQVLDGYLHIQLQMINRMHLMRHLVLIDFQVVS